MSARRVHRRLDRTPDEKARIAALRAQFSKRPAPDELLASGEYETAVPLGQLLKVRSAVSVLKRERQRAGLSLADVSRRSGMDRASISRLENGLQPNPTLDTLYRYAAALGKRVTWSFRDTQRRRHGARQKRVAARQPA